METSEEKKTLDPVEELLEKLKNECSKNGLHCYAVVVDKDDVGTNIGSFINGKLKVLVEAINETMDRDENINRLHSEIQMYAKVKKLLCGSGGPEQLLKIMMG